MAWVCTLKNYSGRAATDQTVRKIRKKKYIFSKERLPSHITREWNCSDFPVDNGVNKTRLVMQLVKSQ